MTIPDGDPGAISKAGAAWARFGETLHSQSTRLRGAATTASSADWQGTAAGAYSLASLMLESDLMAAAEGCHTAAAACRTFAHALEEAQRDAKQAARAYSDAREQQRRASVEAAAQAREATRLHGDATSARGAADATRASGPHHEAAAQEHDRAALAATNQARDAESAAARLNQHASAAGDDADQAFKRGERANRHAEQAAHRAASAMHHVTGTFRDTGEVAAPAVPITVRGGDANPLLPAVMPGLGTIGQTPSDARRAQIAAAQHQAEQDRAAAAKRAKDAADRRKGNALDAAGGLLDGTTGIHAFGRKNTDVYRGEHTYGELAILATGVGGVAKAVGKRVLKKGAEEVAADAGKTLTRKEARKKAAAERKYLKSPEHAAAVKQQERREHAADTLDFLSDALGKVPDTGKVGYLTHLLTATAAALRAPGLTAAARARAEHVAHRLVELARSALK